MFADKFEFLPLYFMTFHGEENIRKVIAVSLQIFAILLFQAMSYVTIQFLTPILVIEFSHEDRELQKMPFFVIDHYG